MREIFEKRRLRIYKKKYYAGRSLLVGTSRKLKERIILEWILRKTECVKLVNMIEDRHQRRALVNKIMIRRVWML